MPSEETTAPKLCVVCGLPLILSTQDVARDHEPEEYEDDCEGMCGSCHAYPKGVNKFPRGING